MSIVLRRAVFVRILNIQICGVTVQKHRIWIIPKYKVKKVLGWPSTQEGIKRLVYELPEDERLVVLCGRFVKMWNGKWQFSFPQTKRVVEAIEGLLPKRKELMFREDTEG